MRVLFFGGNISPHKLPYYERLARQPDMDVTVWFLGESPTRLRDTNVADGFCWEVLSGWSLNIQRQDTEQYFFNPSILWKLLKGKFDVVVVCGWDMPTYWLATALSAHYKIPLVLWSGSTPGSSIYGNPSTNKPAGLRRIARPLVKWVVAQSSTYIAYGTRAGRYLEQLGASPARVYYAWNTVDVARLKSISEKLRPYRESLRQKLGVQPNQILLLYVGRMQPFKRIDTLITAYGELANRNLSGVLGLAGNGPCEAQLRKQAASLTHGEVRFYGHVSLEQIPEYYVAADIFVLPSGDIWGLVVNEAMACGLPIVAADTVGSTEDLVVSGHNGFVYPFQDSGALVHYLECLSTDEVLRKQMGVASEMYIQNFTYDKAIEAISAAVRKAFALGVGHSPQD